MIKQDCNLIVLIIFYDQHFDEEVALFYSPISCYHFIMPTKYILTSEKVAGILYVTEMKNAFFIPSSDVEKKLREWRKRE